MSARISITDPAAAAELGAATELLASIARDPGASPDVALLAHAAADQLQPLAAKPPIICELDADLATAVAQALRHLGALPPDVFADRAVLDAASHARRAHDLLT